jgi:hypothetical protein
MVVLWLALVIADAAPPPSGALYNKARGNMADILKNQPNYTCVETIDRSERMKPKAKFGTIDSLRFEVAVVEKREMYAWPGSRAFGETDILDMVPEGAAIATGSFAGHAQYLFQSNIATVRIGDWVEEDGERYARYPFDVPVERSGYVLMKSRKDQSVVGYSGEIWVEPGTARVKRIHLHANAIPERLDIQSTDTLIEYGAAKIGERQFWLPARSVEEITTRLGRTDRNITRFTGCRAFTGESTLRFDDGPVETTSVQPVQVINLPPGLWFEIQFDEPVDSGHIHVGDVIPATLATDIKQKGQVLFPKGSAVEMHIVRFQHRPDFVSLEVAAGDVTSKTASARLVAVPDPSVRGRNTASQAMPHVAGNVSRPGLGSIYLRGSRIALRKGFRSVWVTTPPIQKENK